MSGPREVRRVVLAIDRAEPTRRVVREAVGVASSLGAELEGLFVEDDALLRLAGHDFARRLGQAGQAQAFSGGDLEREWRALAAEVRLGIEREAERGGVLARFAVSRGAVEVALRERLAGGDLVLVGWAGWAPAAGRRPIRVLYDGTAESQRALALGARLAGRDGELLVWLPADAPRAGALVEEVRERLGRAARVRIAGDAALSTLRRALADEPGGLLLVPAAHDLALQLAHRSVAARFACSVLITSGADRETGSAARS